MSKRHKSLMNKWEGICLLCGELIENKDAATLEHLVPRSKGGSHLIDNLAVTHYRCNQMRGDLSLIEASIVLALHKRTLGDERFTAFINESVPHRYPLLEPGNPLYEQKRKDDAELAAFTEALKSKGSLLFGDQEVPSESVIEDNQADRAA